MFSALAYRAPSRVEAAAEGQKADAVVDAHGNLHLERSVATLHSGADVSMTDVYFNVSADDAAAAGVALPTLADLLGNDSSLAQVLGCNGAATGGLAGVEVAHGGSDAAEVLRRLAALTMSESHTVAAA